MYITKKYSFRDLLYWTRFEVFCFLVIATVVAVLYEVARQQWLRLPWTPLAMIGTAVAFLIGFQNNAAYGRAWEARKIWGGILNESRTFATLDRDLVTNEHTDNVFDQIVSAQVTPVWSERFIFNASW